MKTFFTVQYSGHYSMIYSGGVDIDFKGIVSRKFAML
jgi:hypothetical protein